MSMMDDLYSQQMEQDDPDIPECKTCGKSLDDPTHKHHWENEDDPDGWPVLVCEEKVPTIVVYYRGDESVGIFSQTWEIENIGEIEDNDHREAVRKAFQDAFTVLCCERVDVIFSDEFPESLNDNPTEED